MEKAGGKMRIRDIMSTNVVAVDEKTHSTMPER
jgi:hypothetical protein